MGRSSTGRADTYDAGPAGLRRVPDFDPPDPRTVPVPVEVLVEETKICNFRFFMALSV